MKIIKTFEKFIQDRNNKAPNRYEPDYFSDGKEKENEIKEENKKSDKKQNLTENIND